MMINEQIYFYIYDLLSESEKNKVADKIKTDKNWQKEYQKALHNQKIIEETLRNKKINPLKKSAMLKYLKETGTSRKQVRPFGILIPAFSLTAALLLGLIFIFLFNSYKVGKISYTGQRVSISSLFREPKIKTQKGTKALLLNKKFYKINIDENSELIISRSKKNHFTMRLNTGKAHFDIQKHSGDYYIYTFNSCIHVIGTKFSVNADKKSEKTIVHLDEGRIELWNLNNPDSKTIIMPGDTAVILEGEKPVLPKKAKNKNKKVEKIQEKVYLRNGNVLIGVIENQTDLSLTIRTKYGKFKLDRNDIQQIEICK